MDSNEDNLSESSLVIFHPRDKSILIIISKRALRIQYMRYKFATVYPAIYCRKLEVIAQRGFFSLAETSFYSAGKWFYAAGSRWTCAQNTAFFTVFIEGKMSLVH